VTAVPLAALVDLIRQVLNQYEVEITAQSTGADIPGWDSLAHVVLIIEINDRFGIELSAAEAAALPNVGALHRAVVDAQAALHRHPA
jgi:acyl carrier protein